MNAMNAFRLLFLSLPLFGFTECGTPGGRLFASPNQVDENGIDPSPLHELAISWDQEATSPTAFADVVYYPPAKSFALSDAAGSVFLLSEAGFTSTVTGPDGFGDVLMVVDDLMVTGADNGTLYGWQQLEGDEENIDDVASIVVTGAVGKPTAAKVGDDIWLSDPASGVHRFQGDIMGDIEDLDTVASAPCGAEIVTCGLTMAGDPTGNGALLGLSSGYAQHLNSAGEADWHLAGSFIVDSAIPTPPAGVSRVYTIGERFFVAGYLDGPEIEPSGRWILPEGDIDPDTDIDPYRGAVSAAQGSLDGETVRVYGISPGLIYVEHEGGEPILSFIPEMALCEPAVAIDDQGVVTVVCKGQNRGYIARLSHP